MSATLTHYYNATRMIYLGELHFACGGLDVASVTGNLFPKRHVAYINGMTKQSSWEMRIELLMLSNTQRRAVIGKR